MSTHPRPTKSINSVSAIFERPHSEFDAGVNTSAAWTEHLERGSLSDEEPDQDESPVDNESPARALYKFEGKAEFQELSVDAGDDLTVIKEILPEGWSLVKNVIGEVGLLPRTYYTFTFDFSPAPDLEGPPFSYTKTKKKEVSQDSLTPRGSPNHSPSALPIVPQSTGEWRNVFPSFRKSLLGGKSLNRFSSFVTSGAEDWVLNGTAQDAPPTQSRHEKVFSTASTASTVDGDDNRVTTGEADRHFVEAGPSWKTKLPPFRVMVHSPSKRSSTLSGAYTIYSVTSLFQTSLLHEAESMGDEPEEDNERPEELPTRITVYRRFSHFVVLHTALTRRLPGIALPPLPEKQYAGRFSNDFVEARRGDLERYISRVVRHPVARYAEVVTFFLGCESDSEWNRLVPQHLAMKPAGPCFYSSVFHPAFNLDSEDAEEAVDRFETHIRAVGKGVQGLRNVFGRIREARIGLSDAERLLSYSLLSLFTSKPLASAPLTGVSEEDAELNIKSLGTQNRDGAWCWRENCEDCLKLTKALQKTSETLQSVADLYDDHARRTQLTTHESLKGVAHPSSLYESVIETHRSTLSKYNEATTLGRVNEEMAARCETVLNTTMAEMETYHTQKNEDFTTIAKDHLDGEIALYEQVLARLKSARQAFDPQYYTELGKSPRQPSMYERELEHPRLNSKPLMQPCPHVYDSAPMRPVSIAIQEGVGLLLGNPSGRTSVFGKFFG